MLFFRGGYRYDVMTYDPMPRYEWRYDADERLQVSTELMGSDVRALEFFKSLGGRSVFWLVLFILCGYHRVFKYVCSYSKTYNIIG